MIVILYPALGIKSFSSLYLSFKKIGFCKYIEDHLVTMVEKLRL